MNRQIVEVKSSSIATLTPITFSLLKRKSNQKEKIILTGDIRYTL